ncbi:MAG: hypothetical protein IKP78_00640, partial [Ruminococcus sp.]|nr:hypothetical protein [Ruminococcus sp.]
EDSGKNLGGVTVGEGSSAKTLKDTEKSVVFDGNSAKLTGLKDGRYSLEETAAPDGYTTVTKFTFDVENGVVKNVNVKTDGDAEIADDGKTLIVKDSKSVITIDKKTVGGEPLDESNKAKFRLTAEDSGKNLGGVTVGEGESAKTLKDTEKSVVFDGNTAKITGLKDGKYSLEETVAPDGYTIVTKFTFEVDNGVVKSVKTATDGDAEIADDGKTLIVKDAQSDITINKSTLGGEPLDEENRAEFVLTAEDKGADLADVIVHENNAARKLTAGETSVKFSGNTAQLTGLKDGNYSLEETAAPDGYTTVTKFTFDVENGIVKNVNVTTDGEAEKSSDGKTITVFDTKSVINIDKGTLGGEPLDESNKAKFVLTAEDEGATLDGVILGEGSSAVKLTAEDVSVAFDGNKAHFTGLKDGKYSLEETAAPDGYTTVTKFTFDVENGIVTGVTAETDGDYELAEDGKTLIVKDARSVILIDKKALGGKEIPEDAGKAEFTLTAEDAELTLEGVSINGGDAVGAGEKSVKFPGNSAEFVGLRDGVYSLTEDTAPMGYSVVSKFTFTVENGTVTKVDAVTNGRTSVAEDGRTIVIEDAPEELSISKKDVTGENEIKGATLEITNSDIDWTSVITANESDKDFVKVYSSDDTVIGIQWVSGDTAKIVKALKDGKYTLKETGDQFESGGKVYDIISSELGFVISGGKIVSAEGDDLKDAADSSSDKGYYVVDKENGEIDVCDVETTTATSTSTTTPTTT